MEEDFLHDKPPKLENPFAQTVKTALKGVWEILRGILVLIILAFIVRYFILQPFIVDGTSMVPNFQDKEYLLVNKLSYTFKKPQRGDVIIFRYPLDPQFDFIKRIIGLPKEHIEIKEGKVYINGKILEEVYLSFGFKTEANHGKEKFEITLRDNEYFVLGDNRSNSSDSRSWGTLPKVNIVGKAWFAVVPLANFGFIKHIYPTLSY